MKDRSFANDVARFRNNIYGTPKGAIRQAVLQADLQYLISQPASLKVLDAGAGLGQVNQLFARAGHEVTHTDIAAEMVTAAQTYHSEAGLGARYQYHHCAIQELPDILNNGEHFDVILCHAVLEWLSDPQLAIRILSGLLKPHGWLSLMFYNREAKELANLVYGNFDYVKAGLQVKKKVRFSPQRPISIAEVKDWVLQNGLSVTAHSGVRCIHDYLREREHQQRDDLIAMELTYRRKEPFRSLGRYQHFLLRKI